MTRSRWKGKFCETALIKQAYGIIKKNLTQKIIINVWSRSSTILPLFLGLTFRIYNGKKFTYLTIKPDMFFFKFGEFSYTKRIGIGIHNIKESAKSDKKSEKANKKKK